MLYKEDPKGSMAREDIYKMGCHVTYHVHIAEVKETAYNTPALRQSINPWL